MGVDLSDMDPGSLEDMIGTDCYEAALGYVRRKAVAQHMWIAGQNALFGVVRGSYGEFYTPTVYFSRQGPMLAVRGAQCSCDARYACEHAAALLISAVEGGADAAGMPAIPRQARRPPSWDTSLESLLAAGRDAGRPGETTLAIELTLVAEQPQGRLQGQPRSGSVSAPGSQPTPARPPVRLMARLVQPGKQGGWIGGTLSWGKLDSYGYFGGYPAAQVRLLREMLALYRARVGQPYYYHSPGNERSIELSAFESGRLWPLLDEAGRAGLQLVYGHKLGAVISSDGSFTPPVISDPTLVLRASYGDGHDVQVDWEWAYQVGDSQLRAELHQVPGDTGYRDLAAEQAVLDSLRLGGLPGDPALAPSSRLGGLDTMRFSTELLPLLTGQ